MRTYTIKIHNIFIIFLCGFLVFSCREDLPVNIYSKGELQIYLQANNNKDQVLIKDPISIVEGEFAANDNDLFFAVSTREVSTDTHLTIGIETDSAVIGRYKNEYGKKLPLLPQSSYSLPETITIPAGKSISDKMLAIKWKSPSEIKDRNATYLIPLSIKSMDNKNAILTSNRNTIFIEVKFQEVSYSLNIKTGKTFEDVNFNKAGGTVVLKETKPIIAATLNSPINKDLALAVSIDNSLVTAYNTTHGTQFEALPENTYKLSGTSINIAKDSKVSDDLGIEFTSAISQLDITKQYLLAVKTTTQVNIPSTNNIVYLKINIALNNITSNVPITGTAIDRTNWSVQSDSEYNSEYNSEYIASKMLDGDYNTGWVSNFNGNASVILDMKESNALKGFSITPTYLYNGVYKLFPSSMVIYTSSDGTTWLKQGIYENNKSVNGDQNNPYFGWISFVESVNARYIKFSEIAGFKGIGEIKGIK
ncbi:TPA: BT_3987 domain-containing protein [Elizabethkingia anophelis]